MFDLIIVGAGIAGSCVKRLATEAGLDTCLIDTRVASGLGAMSIVRETTPASRQALTIYRRYGLVNGGAALMDGTGEPLDGYYIVDSEKALLQPDRIGQVKTVKQDGVTLLNNTVIPARLGVIVCAGVLNPTLGGPEYPLKTAAALFYRSYRPTATILHPYQDGALIETNDGRWRRIGTVIGENREAAIQALQDTVEALELNAQGGQIVTGRITVSDQPTQVTWQGDIAYIGGLGIDGYGYAPTLAMEAVQTFVSLKVMTP